VTLLAALVSLAATSASAQTDPPEPSEPTGFAAGSFVFVPIPLNDPTFGAGLVLGTGYLFRLDEGSDTSFVGGGAVATNQGSRAAAIGGSFSASNSRYNGLGFFGIADVNYDLSILGRSVEIEQEAAGFTGEFRYGFTPTLSAGVTLRYLESRLSGLNGQELPPELQSASEVSIGALGLVAQWETRDDNFYPTTGSKLSFTLDQAEELGGRGLSYTRAQVGYDGFWPVFERDVIGMRLSGCHIENRAPFFETCLLGSEIRGFSLFEFYGDQMVTAQAEYRGRFNDRFGYAVFAGIGDVRRNILSRDSGVRSAGGLGLRYRVSKDFNLDMALDVTLNDKNESYVYFSVGQAF
jgi:outer membrane protein assembly factor BamA